LDDPVGLPAPAVASVAPQFDRFGRCYRLGLLDTGMSIPELRWCRCLQGATEDGAHSVSVREAIACLESYEPVRTITRQALELHEGDSAVSIAVLRVELVRIQESPIVLNRVLREAVLAAVERRGLSMSEIAIRCGRVKRDSAGNESGETSWLARRLGLLPEGGRDTPTPWIHTDVLALIARHGLGVVRWKPNDRALGGQRVGSGLPADLSRCAESIRLPQQKSRRA
jgi:hypothetical protein